MLKQYDEELKYENRCLRTRTGKLLFGPNGRRLAVDCLDRVPGFVGSIDFIHKMNIPELFRVTPDIPINFDQAQSIWHPLQLTMKYETEELEFEEIKTVIEEDVALSMMKWRNCTDVPFSLSFSSNPKGFLENKASSIEKDLYGVASISPITRFDFSVGIFCAWNMPKETIVVMPGESVTILAAAAVGNLAQETMEELQEKVRRCLTANQYPEVVMQSAIQANNKFYEKAPSFLCDDRRINACWKYRWYILKNCLARPGYGKFKGAVMYEGRDHRMKKDALDPGGWEFSKLIPLSTPLQVTDFRWHGDHETVKEVIRSAFAGQDEDGLILCSYVDNSSKSYANYMLWAIWKYYLLDSDKEFIRELLPSMIAYIKGHEKKYMDDKDSLLIERKPSLTGKEYQPSYWYFKDFYKNPKDPEGYIPLKRVDRSVYHYLNLIGLANLIEAVLGDGAQKYKDKAEKLALEIDENMWDPETGFYYDLHYETKEKAMVKNIVGVYPYWAEIAGNRRQKGIEKLLDSDLFDTGSAFPSVAKDCRVFSPDGGWMGNFIKGRNGCIWCGPSWPYTTGIALDGLGKESLKREHKFDADFDRLFEQYTIQHFRDGDRSRPYLVEHYNPITGERLSDEADYNHSFWLDLTITYVAGVQVLPNYVCVEPLQTHLKWFILKELPIRGKMVCVMYSEGKDRGEIPKGLTVLVDGKKEAYREDLGRLIIEI